MSDARRESLEVLVVSASLRAESLNARLAFDDTNAGFLDLVEPSTHYPCIKRAWVEFLGEQPDPATDRVDT